jgi:hypothetical protein
MCQRRQNSRTSAAKYGARKFTISRTPKSRATPRAMSEYPEKSR